jgi:hypothetical protein
MHVALGHPPLDPTQPLSCATVRHLAGRGQVVAALRARPLSVPIATASPLPAGWYPSGDGALTTNKGGRIATSFTGHGAVHIWLRGRAFRKLAVLVDGREVGSVRELNGPNQWMDAGGTVLSPGAHRLELVRPIRSLGPGDAQRDVIGPVAVTADVQPRLVRGAALRRACGAPADWIDVVRR